MITCTTWDGKHKQVPKETLIIRPATYGVVEHNDAILLVKSKTLHKWIIPGGGVEKGETLIEALIREVREETAITVTDPILLTFREGFFYNSPTTAFQSYRFFYRCTPKGNTKDIRVIFDEDVIDVAWISKEKLQKMEHNVAPSDWEILKTYILYIKEKTIKTKETRQGTQKKSNLNFSRV